MNNFGIITCNHGRPQVFKLWCAQIKRLRWDFQNFIPAVCVSSSAEDKNTCAEYHVEYISQTNNPVSEKFNRGFQYMHSIGVDYVIITGSDDIMSTALLRNLDSAMDGGYHLIGINGIYFYCGEGLERGRLVKLQAKPILGVARTIHKDVLDRVGWRPYPTKKNWGLDGICMKAIAPYVASRKVVDGICVDVKTRQNINKWTLFSSARKLPSVDTNIFYNILSEEEKQILDKI